MIEIICTNNNQKKNYPIGTNLMQIAEDMQVELQYPILAAKVNNEVKSLRYEIYKNKIITFIDASDISGFMIFERSLHFLLFKAVKDLYPEEQLIIKHSISGGKYCEFDNPEFEVSETVVSEIENQMKKIVEEDIPFERKELLTREALELYESSGLMAKKNLIEDRNYLYTSVYYLDNCINYFYGCLVPSTGYLRPFSLKKYENGMLLNMPSRHNPDKLSNIYKSPKLFSIFNEYKNWNKVLGISYVTDINKLIKTGHSKEIILVSEALQEKKITQIADKIAEKGDVKIVLLSGPSSSGKTTTSKRVSVQLGVLGYNPIPISMDNYFVEREQTPRDKDGNFDFEHLNAIDLDLFNEQLGDLIAGKTIETPVFDFQQGKKLWKGNKMQLGKNGILVIEGIHALNPHLLTNIPQEQTFKIFASALTSIAIDMHNPIHTTDNRLIRRIIRDARYRGYSAEVSLLRWNSVRNGEEKWIFPYQENADEMFNSAICCELNIFKSYAQQLLYQVTEASPAYSEACRLMKMLEYFTALPEKEVPQSSILREFFGGSVFSY